MGPIHHGTPELHIGEKYKLIWAQKYIQRWCISDNLAQDLYKTVADNLAELKSHFADNVTYLKSDEDLAWMLFVDGCSLLYILDIDNIFETENTMMKLVNRDVLLLENQLPFELLKMLILESDANYLIENMKRFLEYNNFSPYRYKESKMSFKTYKYQRDQEVKIHLWEHSRPIHLLDLLHQLLLPDSTHKNKVETSKSISNNVVSYMNIQELKSNGIRIKSNNICTPIQISFSNGWLMGELKLPEIILDDITISTFINLIAYETCPDYKNDYTIGTFLAFINSLVRQPEDVKDLRSAGILISNYGSDEELVKLFRFIATDVVPNVEIYSDVSGEINKHIANKWKTKTVRFLRYIRHLWTNFAVHSAELALAFTVIQTWFAVHPAKS